MNSTSTTTNPPPDENVGPILLIISSILIAFVVITTCLRLYVRARNRILGWDDFTITLVCIIAIIRLGTEIAQSQHGNGRHKYYVARPDYVQSNMWGWYGQILLFLGVCLLKVSICLLILRIKNDRWLKNLLYGVMAGLAITNGSVIIILLAECAPVDAYWTGNGVCWDTRVRIYTIYLTIGYSILTDLLCSFLPLVVVWKVRIPLKTKVLVCGLMSLGLLATGFGIARAASLGIVTSDLTWTYCIAAIWSNCELFLGIIAANLALSRSIYVHFFGETESEFGSSPRGGSTSARSAYLQAKLRGDRFERPKTVIESRIRRPSETKSEDSDIPLEPGIQKKTEFWLSEEDLERSRRPTSSAVRSTTD